MSEGKSNGGMAHIHLRTQLIELQEALRESSASVAYLADLIEQQERLASLGVMTSGVVHELKNAITPIVACASMLRSGRNAENEELIDLVRESSSHASDVLHQFNHFLPSEITPSFTAVSLQTVVERATKLTRFRWKNEATQQGVEYFIDQEVSEDCVVSGNETQLTQLLINLILNAVEAMPSGGRVHIGVREAEDTVDLSVADEGMGVAPEQLGNEFTPFFTTKLSGSGLGLVACQRIAEQHGARIRIQSRPQGGACFVVAFPHPDFNPETQAAVNARPKVLVIDDDATTRHLKHAVLQEFGFDTAVAQDAQHGLSAALQTDYRLVFLDVPVSLPEVADVIHTIRETHPETKVVLMTGWPEKEVTDRFQNLQGLPDYIMEKPYDKVQLRKCVEALAGK